MLKILHIATNLTHGGVEAILYRLISQNSTKADHIIVSMTDLGFYGELLKDAGFRVITLGKPSGKKRLFSIVDLYFLVRKEKPHIVQTWGYPPDFIGGLVARFAGIQHILWGVWGSNLQFSTVGVGAKIFMPLCAISSSLIPEKIVSCSERGIVVHTKHGYIPSKWVFIPPGIDTNLFFNEPCLRNKFISKHKLKKSDFILGCIARWDRLKDHETLFSSISNLIEMGYNLPIFFVGSGMNSSNEQLMALLRKNALESARIFFLGEIESIPKFLSCIDAHVLSSVGEGFPNVLIEAMACSVPCIATDVGDCKTIIANTGWTVPAKDPQALAVAIISAVEEKLDHSKWGARLHECRKRVVENYSLDRMADSYDNLWGLMVKNKK